MNGWRYLLPLLLGGFFLYSCTGSPEAADRGLFSWQEEVLEEEKQQELFAWMQDRDLTVLYQSVPGNAPEETVQEFLTAASEAGVSVYLLTGDPDWGLDPAGEAMQEEVLRTAAYNRGVPEEARFQGVLMDTEPYLTEEWEEDPEAVMAAYVEAMELTAALSRENGLELVACIPYYYDTQDLELPLKRLIQDGCTGVAVMNYYKRNEADHVRTELELAREAQKPLTVIYELQAPGSHGLTEDNTYYQDGIGALEDSWAQLQEELGTQDLNLAVHEYQAAKEVWILE